MKPTAKIFFSMVAVIAAFGVSQVAAQGGGHMMSPGEGMPNSGHMGPGTGRGMHGDKGHMQPGSQSQGHQPGTSMQGQRGHMMGRGSTRRDGMPHMNERDEHRGANMPHTGKPR